MNEKHPTKTETRIRELAQPGNFLPPLNLAHSQSAVSNQKSEMKKILIHVPVPTMVRQNGPAPWGNSPTIFTAMPGHCAVHSAGPQANRKQAKITPRFSLQEPLYPFRKKLTRRYLP